MTVIAAFLGTQTLGDFIMYHLVAASVTRALPGARLVAVYRADRPYKDLITLMNPHVTAIQRLRADPAVVLPLDALETGLGGLPPPDLFLPPSALDAGRMVGAPPALRIPDELAPALAQAGATLNDVVQITTYISEPGVFEAIGPVLGEIFADIRPTNAAVVVDFPVPGVKVEISAIAVIGCGA